MSVKRVFSNLNNFQSKILSLHSENDYVKNKFITSLSQKIYSMKNFCIFSHNTLRSNFINEILIPELDILITTNENIGDLILDLDVVIEKNINSKISKNEIDLLENEFSLCKKKVQREFLKLSSLNQQNLNEIIFEDFKKHFLSKIFKNPIKKHNFVKEEFLISSITLKSFISFSNQTLTNENNVFVLNDKFNLFKGKLLEIVFKHCENLNIDVEIYKNPFDENTIDHLKIPSLSLFILSRDYLFNEKCPGTQINEDDFLNKNSINLNLNNLNFMIKNLKIKGNYIENKFLSIETQIQKNINQDKFQKLLNYAIKNVIR